MEHYVWPSYSVWLCLAFIPLSSYIYNNIHSFELVGCDSFQILQQPVARLLRVVSQRLPAIRGESLLIQAMWINSAAKNSHFKFFIPILLSLISISLYRTDPLELWSGGRIKVNKHKQAWFRPVYVIHYLFHILHPRHVGLLHWVLFVVSQSVSEFLHKITFYASWKSHFIRIEITRQYFQLNSLVYWISSLNM